MAHSRIYRPTTRERQRDQRRAYAVCTCGWVSTSPRNQEAAAEAFHAHRELAMFGMVWRKWRPGDYNTREGYRAFATGSRLREFAWKLTYEGKSVSGGSTLRSAKLAAQRHHAQRLEAS